MKAFAQRNVQSGLRKFTGSQRLHLAVGEKRCHLRTQHTICLLLFCRVSVPQRVWACSLWHGNVIFAFLHPSTGSLCAAGGFLKSIKVGL